MKYEDLKILDELREKGSITEEEFQREKAKILSEDNNSNSDFPKKPLFGLSEINYIMLMHLSQLAIWIIPIIPKLSDYKSWLRISFQKMFFFNFKIN